MRRVFQLLLALMFIVSMADDVSAQKKRRKRRPRKKPVPAKVEKSKAAPAPEKAPTKETDETRALQRGERIEFDARLIQGQTAKAGAVYLFERARTDLRSMVNDRTSFRDRIIRMVFPRSEDLKGKEETKR